MNIVHYPLYGTANPNITAAGTSIIMKAPSDANGGGITIREAFANVRSGTVTLTLVDLGSTGTAVGGTVCAIAVAVGAGVGGPVAGTPNAYWLDGGNYLGVVYGVGTVVPPGGLEVGYVRGR